MSDLRESLFQHIDLTKSHLKPYQGFIFLCGGPSDGKSLRPISIRDAIYRELVKSSDLEKRIRVAEHYKDWAHDSIYTDLLQFEQHLAELSSVIVLAVESPGAIAELGLFSAIPAFQKKILVFLEKTHYLSDSFIKLGPIDFLEKTHNNKADVHRWLKANGKEFDVDAAEKLQGDGDLTDSINQRLISLTGDSLFQKEQWLHWVLLVCDLLNLMSALTIREIRDYLGALGILKTETEIRQALYLLERVELLTMQPKGDQRFYLSITNANYMKLHITDKKVDLSRFRLDVLEQYKSNDKKRYRVIQEQRGIK